LERGKLVKNIQLLLGKHKKIKNDQDRKEIKKREERPEKINGEYMSPNKQSKINAFQPTSYSTN
jgi:hypothetical protein